MLLVEDEKQAYARCIGAQLNRGREAARAAAAMIDISRNSTAPCPATPAFKSTAMPSRRHIREAVVQFLYCADLEGGADPAGAARDRSGISSRNPTAAACSSPTFRTVHHLAHRPGRSTRVEFVERQTSAATLLSAWPEAESLKSDLTRIAELESGWSTSFAKLERLPKDDDDAAVAESFGDALEALSELDRELAAARRRFLQGIEDFPALRGQLEAVAASIRRLQRISDRAADGRGARKISRTSGSRPPPRLESGDPRPAQRSRRTGGCHPRQQGAASTRPSPPWSKTSRPSGSTRWTARSCGSATYELLHAETPPKVVINECIELAKRFGTTDSRRFVNGVLDKIAKQAVEKSDK